jgi:hypothetical protein
MVNVPNICDVDAWEIAGYSGIPVSSSRTVRREMGIAEVAEVVACCGDVVRDVERRVVESQWEARAETAARGAHSSTHCANTSTCSRVT